MAISAHRREYVVNNKETYAASNSERIHCEPYGCYYRRGGVYDQRDCSWFKEKSDIDNETFGSKSQKDLSDLWVRNPLSGRQNRRKKKYSLPGAIALMPRQLRSSIQNSRFLGDSPVHGDAHTTIVHWRTMNKCRTMALWLRQLGTRCAWFYSPKIQVSKPEQRAIAAMPRQRSVLIPEAHASNAFQPPTAKP